MANSQNRPRVGFVKDGALHPGPVPPHRRRRRTCRAFRPLVTRLTDWLQVFTLTDPRGSAVSLLPSEGGSSLSRIRVRGSPRGGRWLLAAGWPPIPPDSDSGLSPASRRGRSRSFRLSPGLGLPLLPTAYCSHVLRCNQWRPGFNIKDMKDV